MVWDLLNSDETDSQGSTSAIQAHKINGVPNGDALIPLALINIELGFRVEGGQSFWNMKFKIPINI